VTETVEDRVQNEKHICLRCWIVEALEEYDAKTGRTTSVLDATEAFADLLGGFIAHTRRMAKRGRIELRDYLDLCIDERLEELADEQSPLRLMHG
jgi:hypothetical protein